MSSAYVIDARDNVATALSECLAGRPVPLRGESATATLVAVDRIPAQHKLATADIAAGAAVIKYGMPIGHAIAAIRAGQWVHLHNCASTYDARSGTLDGASGAPTDTPYV